jgi:hypothetical protein
MMRDIEVHEMPVDVLSEIEIRCPREVVASFAANPDNAPNWYANIRLVEWRTKPPLRVGSQIDFIAAFLGRRLAYTYEVVDYAPTERLVMRASQGPFPMETTYLWKTIAGGHTRMTLRNRGEPKGFSRLVAPFMSSAMRRANRKDLALLKRILEQDSEPAARISP